MEDNIEDDADFNLLPGGKSHLANLFSSQPQMDGGDVNQSLTYVAPKQPKKTGTQSAQNADSSQKLHIIHVIPAYTFKLKGGQYTSQGKLGIAILGNHEARKYSLLLYKGKNITVNMTTIDQHFKFLIEPNNYAKFSTDNNEEWSVSFKSEAEFIDLTKQVALAKVNSLGKPPITVVIQDLIAGEGSAAEIGDSITFSFTGRLYKNFGFSHTFDTSSAGKKSVIILGDPNASKGWSEGLTNAKKNLKRLIFMPVAYNSDFVILPETITSHDVLAFTVTVHKIKRTSDKSRSPSLSKNNVDKKPDIPPKTHSLNDDIRSRGASLSEQLTQSPKKDSDIVSRMARIGGLHLLPQTPVNVQTSSESEPEKEVEQVKPKSRKQSSASPKHTVQQVSGSEESSYATQMDTRLVSPNVSFPLSQHGNGLSHAPHFTSAESVHYLQQPYMSHQHMIPIMSHTIPSPMGPTLSNFESQLPLLVAETRSQNTELRFNMNKIGDKIDSALLKLDEIRQYQGSRLNYNQVPYMESDVLARNIERIVQENMKLKDEAETKNSKIQELNGKLCDALEGNQKLLQANNSILEQKSDKSVSNYQTQIQFLEMEKAALTSKVEDAKLKLDPILKQVSDLQEEINLLQQKLLTSEELCLNNKEMIALLTSEKEENENLIRTLQENLNDEVKMKDYLNAELKLKKVNLEEAEIALQQLKTRMVDDSENKTLVTEEMQALKEEIRTLKEKLQAALGYQQQYTALRQNTILMKEKYENRIMQLTEELRTKPSSSSPNFPAELRKTMNKLYKMLQNEIDINNTYSGSLVLNTCLSVIKKTTFAILGQSQGKGDTVKEQTQKERADSTSSQPETNVNKSIQPKNSNDECFVLASEPNHSANAQESQAPESDEKLEHNFAIDSAAKESIEQNLPLVTSSGDENIPSTESSAKENSVPKIECPPEITEQDEKLKEIKPEAPIPTCDKPDVSEGINASVSKHEETEQTELKKRTGIEEPSSLAKQDCLVADSTLLTDSANQNWRPQPSPPPLFDDDDEEEDEDDWLK